jgi:hypothetical protein
MTRPEHVDSTWRDPIVEEVRAAREELFASCGYDLDKFVAQLRESERQRGRSSVSYPRREPSREPAE